VAQIRDFLSGNFFHAVDDGDDAETTKKKKNDDYDYERDKCGGKEENKNGKSLRVNVALAMRCTQSFLAHFLALSEIPSVNFTVLLNSRWSFEEAKRAMEHCECSMLIVDDFHLQMWTEFDGRTKETRRVRLGISLRRF
jgi:hypothetical protein